MAENIGSASDFQAASHLAFAIIVDSMRVDMAQVSNNMRFRIYNIIPIISAAGLAVVANTPVASRLVATLSVGAPLLRGGRGGVTSCVGRGRSWYVGVGVV